MGGARLGDAEVHDLGLARLGQHDVRGLDVAVDNVVRVRRLKRPGHLGDDRGRLFPGEGAARKGLGEGLAANVLESHEEQARLEVAADVVNPDHVRLVEGGGDSRLREKALLEGFAFVRREDGHGAEGLEGHGPAEGGVLRLVDHAHRAAAKFALDPVSADLGGRMRGHAGGAWGDVWSARIQW